MSRSISRWFWARPRCRSTGSCASVAAPSIALDSSEPDEVRILANNLPVAKGTVIVSGNRIAVEVKELLPRAPGAC